MASNYNRLPRPAVVFVENGDHQLVVRRETYEDIIRLDIPLQNSETRRKNLRKRNITLLIFILVAAIVWGGVYWYFIAPNANIESNDENC